MILDKLMEKKDLAIYCRFRIIELESIRDRRVAQITPEMSKNKKKAINKDIMLIRGRIRELKRIKGMALGNQLKKDNKRMIRQVCRR
jgi:hypothetical protein